MGKKATILATTCVMIAVVVFFQFFLFSVSIQQITPIEELWSHISDWKNVNRAVIVEGNLSSIDSPYIEPYNYKLVSFGATDPYAPHAFAVLWNGSITHEYAPVMIRGFVKEGLIYLPDNQTAIDTIPYIEAQTVDFLPQS
jgi:hypothetical protein